MQDNWIIGEVTRWVFLVQLGDHSILAWKAQNLISMECSETVPEHPLFSGDIPWTELAYFFLEIFYQKDPWCQLANIRNYKMDCFKIKNGELLLNHQQKDYKSRWGLDIGSYGLLQSHEDWTWITSNSGILAPKVTRSFYI